MHIKNINVNNIGGIDSLSLSFDQQMNLICGPNGIGKTTLLDCVSHLFTNIASTTLKRKVNTDSGHIDASVIDNQGTAINIAFDVTGFSPRDFVPIGTLKEKTAYVFNLKKERTFDYQHVTILSTGEYKQDYQRWSEAVYGVDLINGTKSWFVHQQLFSFLPEALTDSQKSNLELAKKTFSILNKDFVFEKLTSTHDIMVSTPAGSLPYEYLSSGFKSCITIIHGMIREIETRFPDRNAVDLEAIVLIDEIETHLHPEWQSKIAKAISDIFPKLQFLITTHSPHVIQHAEPNTIIALERNNGKVERRLPPSAEFGFKGWTIEEVLEDVMGMPDTRTTLFNYLINNFEEALDQEDSMKARYFYTELEKILHPNNSLRKIIRLQLAGLGVKA